MNKKRLFFDIETSFNITWTWRTGKQYVSADQIIHERAIICICWKWEGEDKVHSLTWDRNQSDEKMLRSFIKELNKANEVIAHNGDKFDIKWLRTRCLKHRIEMFPSYQSLDTLKLVRDSFNLNSNKLNYIAEFLGLEGKMETGGSDLWKNVILKNDQVSLDKMVEYCKKDVKVLEAVYHEIKNYGKHKTHLGVNAGGEKYGCPECGSINQHCNKVYTTAAGTPKVHLRCVDCGKSHTVSNKTYIGLMRYKEKHNK